MREGNAGAKARFAQQTAKGSGQPSPLACGFRARGPALCEDNPGRDTRSAQREAGRVAARRTNSHRRDCTSWGRCNESNGRPCGSLSPTTAGSCTPRRVRPSGTEGRADFGCYAGDFTPPHHPEDEENDLSKNGNASAGSRSRALSPASPCMGKRMGVTALPGAGACGPEEASRRRRPLDLGAQLESALGHARRAESQSLCHEQPSLMSPARRRPSRKSAVGQWFASRWCAAGCKVSLSALR